MSLQYLDKNLLGQYLSAAWKKNLNTGKDPANGRWYEDGANHDKVGLYGGLTDNLATQLIFDTNQQVYQPQQVVTATAVADNRNGLAPHQTVQLSHQYSNTTSVTHSETIGFKVGISESIKAKADFIVAGAEETTTLSVEFNFSWTESKTETQSVTDTFSQQVPIDVPSGKVYQAILYATNQVITVPYRALVYVNGRTETWFEDRVQGHFNWSVDAATMFTWINQYGAAGAQSHMYGSDGSQGIVTIHGTLTAQQLINFDGKIYDITSTYIDHSTAPGVSRVAVNNAPGQGQLVNEIKF